MRKHPSNVRPDLPREKARRRFTLIELLVVIAIIAILAAILLPALNSARERGRSAKCINNLKNITSATMQYADAYDDFFPRQKSTVSAYSDTDPIGALAALVVLGYTDVNILFCDTAVGMMGESAVKDINTTVAKKEWKYLISRVTYGMNAYACGDPSSAPSLKTGNFRSPSASISYADAATTSGNEIVSSATTVTQGAYIIQKKGAAYKWGAIYDYHKNSANLAWVDGHVSNMTEARKTVHDGTDKYLDPEFR